MLERFVIESNVVDLEAGDNVREVGYRVKCFRFRGW